MKKTWLLRGVALLCLCLFVFLVCESVLILQLPHLWFYSFCLCVGIYELCKGFFFRFDSALYFGTLMLGIGSSGYLFFLLDLMQYGVFFIGLAFIFASLNTFFFCHQKFHLIIAYSISFVTLYGFLLVKNLITTPIFIAFVVMFLVQLTVSIILNIKKGI